MQWKGHFGGGVLNGKMNFIGPRPALFNQNDLIKLRTLHSIHMQKPGITGLAQVNGRDSLSVEQKVEEERYYLKNKSQIMFKFINLIMDGFMIKILILVKMI